MLVITSGRSGSLATRHLILCVDLGGTNVRIALVDGAGQVLVRVIEPTAALEGPSSLVDRVARNALAMIDTGPFPKPAGVAAAVPGPIDVDGVMYHPPNLVGWGIVPFRKMLEDRLGMPVWVGNDANVACLGVHTFGEGRGVDNLIYLTISTGVGGGVISGGQIVTGLRGMASEIGHMIIDRTRSAGSCGHRGCLESLISGTAIARFARDALEAGAPSVMTDAVGGDIKRIKAEHVFQASEDGDELASNLVSQVADDLGTGLVALVHLFNPELIVIGGGVGRRWAILESGVRKVLKAETFPVFLEGMELKMSGFGDDTGILGAAALALRDFDGQNWGSVR